MSFDRYHQAQVPMFTSMSNTFPSNTTSPPPPVHPRPYLGLNLVTPSIRSVSLPPSPLIHSFPQLPTLQPLRNSVPPPRPTVNSFGVLFPSNDVNRRIPGTDVLRSSSSAEHTSTTTTNSFFASDYVSLPSSPAPSSSRSSGNSTSPNSGSTSSFSSNSARSSSTTGVITLDSDSEDAHSFDEYDEDEDSNNDSNTVDNNNNNHNNSNNFAHVSPRGFLGMMEGDDTVFNIGDSNNSGNSNNNNSNNSSNNNNNNNDYIRFGGRRFSFVTASKTFERSSAPATNTEELVECVLSGNLDLLKKIYKSWDSNVLARLNLLHLACASGHDQIVDYFLRNLPIDPTVTSTKGWTPLHYAVCNGNLECVKILLRWNMSLKDIKDINGKKPIEYCTDPVILEFLQSGRCSTAPTLKSLLNTTEISSLTVTELRSLSIDLDYFRNKLNHEILKKEKLEKLQNFCVVCMEKEKDVLLQPCNHVCVCYDCVHKLESCPMCRTSVTSHTKVFF